MLLQCLLPWLENMELLASSIPATVSPLSYIMYYPDTGLKGRRDGAGSTEATEMILNNLFYITAKVIDDVMLRLMNELLIFCCGACIIKKKLKLLAQKSFPR